VVASAYQRPTGDGSADIALVAALFLIYFLPEM